MDDKAGPSRQRSVNHPLPLKPEGAAVLPGQTQAPTQMKSRSSPPPVSASQPLPQGLRIKGASSSQSTLPPLPDNIPPRSQSYGSLRDGQRDRDGRDGRDGHSRDNGGGRDGGRDGARDGPKDRDGPRDRDAHRDSRDERYAPYGEPRRDRAKDDNYVPGGGNRRGDERDRDRDRLHPYRDERRDRSRERDREYSNGGSRYSPRSPRGYDRYQPRGYREAPYGHSQGSQGSQGRDNYRRRSPSPPRKPDAEEGEVEEGSVPEPPPRVIQDRNRAVYDRPAHSHENTHERPHGLPPRPHDLPPRPQDHRSSEMTRRPSHDRPRDRPHDMARRPSNDRPRDGHSWNDRDRASSDLRRADPPRRPEGRRSPKSSAVSMRPPTPPLPGSPPPPPPPDSAPPPPPGSAPSSGPPPPASPRERTSVPPPPPGSGPPPPPDSPKAPAAHRAARPLRREGSGAHAPNRNLLEPVTRVSTPTPSGAYHPVGPKMFRFPTAAEENESLGRHFIGTSTLAAYDLGLKLGEGTFGVVTKAVELATKRPVALKKLIMHNTRDGVSVTTVREIKILKELHHQNIVPLIDMVVERKIPGDRSHRGEVFMVFPYMDHDLCGLLLNKDFRMTHSVAKLLMRQILEGLSYMHSNNIIHRDLKTANILVGRDGQAMIADFGLARTLGVEEMPAHSPHEYTNMVVTRWYRAPELLLGDRKYTTAIDLWSMGCILGEMYLREPIFPGSTDKDQLFKIFSRAGPPSKESWPGWKALPGFPECTDEPWDMCHRETTLLQCGRKWQMDRAGADLMIELLRIDPLKRPTAEKALEHVWFWTDPLPAKIGTIPVVESSHEMTTREREPAAIAPPAYQRPRAPAWSTGARPPVRPPGGRPTNFPARPAAYPPGNQFPPAQRPPFQQAYRPPGQNQQFPPQPSNRVPNPGFRLSQSGGPGGGGGGTGPARGPPGFKLAGGRQASGPSFGGPGGPGGGPGGPGGGLGGPGGPGGQGGPGAHGPLKRSAPDDWRSDKRPRRDDSLPY